jgi:hypothetical protein
MILRIIACGIAAAALTSCQLFQAKPAADSGFNRSTAHTKTRAEFLQKTWVAKDYHGKPIQERFTAIYIAPVNTRYMSKQSWWQQQTGARKAELASDTEQLAQRIREEFKTTITRYPGSKLRVANAPGKGVLVIELALVELVPSNAYWNAGATAAGFVIPGAGLLSAAGRGSIAIEGRAKDGATNQLIATFKDRREDKVAAVNLAAYTWYHGAEGNITDWANEFAELLNTPPDHVVKRASPLTLMTW